jgi:hypothetical protein
VFGWAGTNRDGVLSATLKDNRVGSHFLAQRSPRLACAIPSGLGHAPNRKGLGASAGSPRLCPGSTGDREAGGTGVLRDHHTFQGRRSGLTTTTPEMRIWNLLFATLRDADYAGRRIDRQLSAWEAIVLRFRHGVIEMNNR